MRFTIEPFPFYPSDLVVIIFALPFRRQRKHRRGGSPRPVPPEPLVVGPVSVQDAPVERATANIAIPMAPLQLATCQTAPTMPKTATIAFPTAVESALARNPTTPNPKAFARPMVAALTRGLV
ncbi:hypothetical protein H257_08835 [Aphanomyces astaci]|uniref:Uncharacterized protein n=1 Tax=Aphanomyces astaci TaxID=112090 RepID=W4GDR2_APHAT|nr:hypothetical protein H257_08835 [Aphanomyces astaci]ETV77416.1 hypothetical protein H257_08835 [Aphanomyces astaci]|eukprot:XP_009833203.1 hypothetical protein H257_08835 [Aphanomyces astaci]